MPASSSESSTGCLPVEPIMPMDSDLTRPPVLSALAVALHRSLLGRLWPMVWFGSSRFRPGPIPLALRLLPPTQPWLLSVCCFTGPSLSLSLSLSLYLSIYLSVSVAPIPTFPQSSLTDIGQREECNTQTNLVSVTPKLTLSQTNLVSVNATLRPTLRQHSDQPCVSALCETQLTVRHSSLVSVHSHKGG